MPAPRPSTTGRYSRACRRLPPLGPRAFATAVRPRGPLPSPAATTHRLSHAVDQQPGSGQFVSQRPGPPMAGGCRLSGSRTRCDGWSPTVRPHRAVLGPRPNLRRDHAQHDQAPGPQRRRHGRARSQERVTDARAPRRAATCGLVPHSLTAPHLVLRDIHRQPRTKSAAEALRWSPTRPRAASRHV